jgi:BASS family bile acid:Na+ symporter
MQSSLSLVVSLSHFIHRRFLWLLIAAYAAAALCPHAGLLLHQSTLGELSISNVPVRITPTLALLALLLFNAGLAAETGRLGSLVFRPGLLVAGLAANLLLPLALVFVAAQGLRLWHDAAEAQALVAGLLLVAAMPVAGSSASWVQKSDGDLSLSLGLVVVSTLISPWTTPLALQSAALLTDGDCVQAFNGLADTGAGPFLLVGVVLPSLLGLLAGALLGRQRVARLRPLLKPLSSATLLVLCYANAAASLPQAAAHPDWDFLALVGVAAIGICAACFAAGWVVAHLLRADPAQRTALMFGLGMSNNGTGLTLAATALSSYPEVSLPLIIYNLVQHVVAGAAGSRITRMTNAPPMPHQ